MSVKEKQKGQHTFTYEGSSDDVVVFIKFAGTADPNAFEFVLTR